MKIAVILAAGEGTKVWPYAEIRPKALIPVGGTPILGILIEQLKSLGFEKVVVAGGQMSEQLVHYCEGLSSSGSPDIKEGGPKFRVKVIRTDTSRHLRGTAYTLWEAGELLGDDPFLVLYGDTVLERTDITKLISHFVNAGDRGDGQSSDIAVALVSPLGKEVSQDWICCRISEGRVSQIAGHPREGFTHHFCAFVLPKSFLPYCGSNAGIFSSVQVGMMPPLEGYLEMSLVDWTSDGHTLLGVETEGVFFDIDKPWHILQANDWRVQRMCGALSRHELAEGAAIDATADVNGFVRLGPNSRIGRHVTINGNLIVGRNTVIENGVVLQGNHVIGDDTYIGHYCYLAAGSTVGNRCVLQNGAELDGMILDNVYLYHYMEFYGIVGTCTDLGAATVCGTLRFDDGPTTHRIKGRRETPQAFADAVFLGDYARTGVNAILMPGAKVGIYSIVGPGVILHGDLPNRQIVMQKQELEVKPWGPERYGW